MKKTPRLAAARYRAKKTEGSDPNLASDLRPLASEVEAVQWKGDRNEMKRFCGKQITRKTFSNRELWLVPSPTEVVEVKRDDWVVRDGEGKLKVVSDEEFREQYEAFSERAIE